MEKKLPENSYTKTTNDIFNRFFWFWISYRWAIDINFLLAKYINNEAPNHFLWLTIALLYTFFEKAVPTIQSMDTKRRYLLIGTVFVVLIIFHHWALNSGIIGGLEISITKR